MKFILSIFILVVFSSLTTKEYYEGTYLYNSLNFHEEITLLNNGKFIYSCKNEFLRTNIEGNYHIYNDSLFLDSYPQRDKLLVNEQSKGKKNTVYFDVKDKNGTPIHYTLYLLLENNTVFTIENQWDKTKVKDKKIKGFYIVDKKGLRSPTYYNKGLFSNCFKVNFETNRVFENEIWVFENNKLKPKGLNGVYQGYYLTKNN